MDLPRPTASAALLTRLGVEHGLSDQACLQGTGLSAADLEDPAGEVVAEQELRIIENLLERLNDPPGLGLEAGVRYHLTTYGIWGFALISSPSMRSVIETGLRYLDLTFAHSRITAEECGTGLRILLDASDIAPKLRRFILEREAASIRTIQRELGFGAEGIREIAFAFAAPETLDCYVDVFGLAPTFDAPITSALVDAELLDLPLPQADTHATAMALAQCEDLLARRTARAGVAGQVRQLLLSRPADPPTAGEAAALLNQAERSRGELNTLVSRVGEAGEVAVGILTVRALEGDAGTHDILRDDLWLIGGHFVRTEAATQSLSFRGDAKHRTRNLEIPGLVLRTIPE